MTSVDLDWPLVFCLILTLQLFADSVLLSDLDFSRYCHWVLKFPPFWIYNLRGIWCCFAFEFPKNFSNRYFNHALWLADGHQIRISFNRTVVPEASWTYPTYLPVKLPICSFAPSAFELWMVFMLVQIDGLKRWKWATLRTIYFLSIRPSNFNSELKGVEARPL